jgi:hypothetical protein
MSFISTAPVVPRQVPIVNDGFFPDIDLDAVPAALRLDGTVTPERLRAAVVEAVLSINAELADWKTGSGVGRLADVAAPMVDGQSAHVHRYLRAVLCTARANLIERYRDFDTTAAGERRALSLEAAVDDLRRDARWAVSDILGIPRSTVALI